MNSPSPIVLFTYKRFETLKKTIQCLSDNFLASDSDLIIYSDGAKNIQDIAIIEEIRAYLKTITGFKSVTIYESSSNKGLAASIIQGVSDVLKLYPSAIILEDDLITSKNFLIFMNQSLHQYETNHEVFSVSGYTPDITSTIMGNDSFFLNRSWSWGWATWQNRWSNIDWELKTYQSFSNNIELKRKFSYLGSDVNKMLERQMSGYIDSWYIRFLYHQFMINGLTLYPKVSKIYNNGFDDLATHNKGSNRRFHTPIDESNNVKFTFPLTIEIDKLALKNFNKINNFRARIYYKLLNIFFVEL